MIKVKRRKEDKIKLNKKISLRFFKEHKRITTCLIVVFVLVGSFLTINYGRYVKDIIEVYYLRTKNFYFTSDKLTIHGKDYEINPWGGTTNYNLSISMSSLLNSLKGTDTDIIYDLSCSTDNNVECYINTPGVTMVERTIKSEDNADNFIITIAPKSGVTLHDGDKVSVVVTAKSKSPYIEELSATFNLIIGNYGINYEIEDTPGNVYLDAIVSNTLDTSRAEITLTINDPSIVIDMSTNILEDPNTRYETELTYDYKDDDGDGVIDDDATKHNYIKKITFVVEPKSSIMVRYYKKIPSNNYSYVNGDTNQPVISFDKRIIE